MGEIGERREREKGRKAGRERESDGFFGWNVQNALVSSCFCNLFIINSGCH